MSFITHEWKDRESTYSNRRTLTDVSTNESVVVDVERDEGASYIENGIEFTADTMNDIEERILEAFNNAQTELNKRLNLIYPIGSVYISKDNTNPATVLGGGTWESITGGVLLPSNSALVLTGSDSITVPIDFDTSFNATVDKAYAELPRHNHAISALTTQVSGSGIASSAYYYNNDSYITGKAPSGEQSTHSHSFSNGNINTKGSIAFNNMMPSTIVYAWRRIA